MGRADFASGNGEGCKSKLFYAERFLHGAQDLYEHTVQIAPYARISPEHKNVPKHCAEAKRTLILRSSEQMTTL